MRFLLINQFYPPDVAPTGQLLHDVARTLVARGHEVSVLCSRHPYGGDGKTGSFAPREVVDGVEVRRLRAFGFGRRTIASRLADYGSFFAGAVAQAAFARPRPDLVLSLTTPPYVGVIPRLTSALRGIPHAHWLMDVYPDVMVAHGMLPADHIAVRALQALTRQHLRNAGLVLSLGPRMHGRVRRYVNGNARAAWVPLWSHETVGPAPEEDRARVRSERGWKDDDLVLLYSGNIGLGHRIGEFLEAARRLGPSGPWWSFVGGGPRRYEVARFIAENLAAPVQLLPYVPRPQLRESLTSADVHLVSVSSPWQELMFPSKVTAAFSVGRPVIFVGGRENDAAAWIEEAGGGWIVPEDDVDALLRAVEEARDPEERRRRGAAGLAFARDHFAGGTNCVRISELLEECVAPKHEPAPGTS